MALTEISAAVLRKYDVMVPRSLPTTRL